MDLREIEKPHSFPPNDDLPTDGLTKGEQMILRKLSSVEQRGVWNTEISVDAYNMAVQHENKARSGAGILVASIGWMITTLISVVAIYLSLKK